VSEPLIRYQGVWKAFGDHVVLAGIDLDVARGEITALLGPSGTGKTVLLKLLVGLLRPDAGRVLFDGRDVAAIGERQLAPIRRRIGFVFQGSALFDSLSVEENVAYSLKIPGDRPAQEIRRRVEECLELVGLSGVGGLAPAQLSGGMRKRVALARALASGPEVLLYDEPTVGLDPAAVRRIARLITSLRERLANTAIVVTHDSAVALEVADRVVLLSGGTLAWSGAVEEARRAPPPALVEFLVGQRGVP
jgi:phospholipid/cholesterol/gamma-HCH transport system ATP-binding protein